MSVRWDLIVYDKNNQLALIVEVKNKINAPIEWASQFRRNILSHGILPNAPFFMMAFPDRFFLWKDAPAIPDPLEPNFTINATPIFKQNIENPNEKYAPVSESSLEMKISLWLSILIHKKTDQLEPYEKWVIDSGLYDAIAGGRLEEEALV